METHNASTELTVIASPVDGMAISKEVAQYVDRYQSFARKTAESIIGLATTLVEAEQGLNRDDFAAFCHQVGIEVGKSTYSKLKTIGTNATRFNPFLERLPNNWTTLYELAVLSPDQFEVIIADLTPFTTAKQVREALNCQNKNANAKNVIDLSISFGSMGSVAKKEVYDAILELSYTYPFSLKESRLFESEMQKLQQTKKAA